MGALEEIHFREGEFELSVRVEPQAGTVWLNRLQMSQLFDRDIKTIGKHIQSALREELDNSTVAKFATTAGDGKTYQVEYYNLDMIISVGYRVKSARGVQFRRWATNVLRQYLMQGYVCQQKRRYAPTPETSGFFNQTIHHQPMRFQQIIFTKWVE